MGFARSSPAAELVRWVGLRFALTGAEVRVLDAALESSGHHYLSARLGVTVNTIKKHVGAILAKTHAATLEELMVSLRSTLLRM